MPLAHDVVSSGGTFSALQPSDNRLLSLLTPGLLERLAPHLDLVELEWKEQLFRAQEPVRAVYFPVTAVVSLLVRLESGEALEVGMVGRDGAAGAAVVAGVATMPCDAIVQVPGFSLRIRADEFKQVVLANEPLKALIGRYSELLLARSMQLSACNTFHSAEQRCIRWLLTVNDLIGQDDIPMTHDFLASMLGVRRPTVALVVGSLQRSGLVEDERGRILIRDRRQLEAACCECYRVMCEAQERLLGYGCREVAPLPIA